MEESLQLNLYFSKFTEPNIAHNSHFSTLPSSPSTPSSSFGPSISSEFYSHIKLDSHFAIMPSAPASPSQFSPSLSHTGSTILSAPTTPSTGIPSRFGSAITHANANENASAASTHHDLPLPPPVTPASSACAACKYQRRKCGPECMLAPYFPPERQHEFQNAHKLFGVSNIVKKLRKLPPHHRQNAVDTMVFEANMHAEYPSGGCHRIVLELEHDLALLETELSRIQSALALCRNVPSNSDASLQEQQYEDQSRSSFLSSEDVNPSQNKLENMVQEQEYFHFYGNLTNGKNNHISNTGSHGIAYSYVNNDNYYHNEGEQESDRDEIRTFMHMPNCSENEEGQGQLVCKSGVDMTSLNLALDKSPPCSLGLGITDF